MQIESAVFVAAVISSCCGLRLISYHIPSVIDFRNTAELTCEFDPEGDILHSVRWYVNGNEFFKASIYGHNMQYNDGVSVQMHKSNMTTVVLAPLYFTTSGEFKCEATTLPPFQRSLSISKTMTVVALPKTGPSIEGIHSRHIWGQLLPFNCTSAPSYPPAEISWTIQGQPIPEDLITIFEDEEESELRIRSTKSGVILRTEELPFEPEGEVTVSCIAFVPGVYNNMVNIKLSKASRI